MTKELEKLHADALETATAALKKAGSKSRKIDSLERQLAETQQQLDHCLNDPKTAEEAAAVPSLQAKVEWCEGQIEKEAANYIGGGSDAREFARIVSQVQDALAHLFGPVIENAVEKYTDGIAPLFGDRGFAKQTVLNAPGVACAWNRVRCGQYEMANQKVDKALQAQIDLLNEFAARFSEGTLDEFIENGSMAKLKKRQHAQASAEAEDTKAARGSARAGRNAT